MDWIGHTNEDGDQQKLIDHLNNVSKLAGEFSEKFGMRNIGEIIGKFHDIGKYSIEFQTRVRGGTNRVDHSTAGAQLVRKIYNCSDITDLLISLPIMSHHSGLCDLGSCADTQDLPTFRARMKRNTLPNYNAYLSEVEKIPLDIPQIQKAINKLDPSSSEIERYLYLSTLTRLLYSSLVDADFLDTEAFMSRGKIKRKNGDAIVEIYETVKEKLDKKGWLKDASLVTLNGRRSQYVPQF